MPTVVIQKWLESERGWGCRPDGVSLHLSEVDRKAYIKFYWDRMPDEVQSEYSRPEGSPTVVDVREEVYARVKNSDSACGLRIWQHDLGKYNLYT